MSKNLSRRDFLRGTAASALGLAAASVLGTPVLAEEKGTYTPGTYSAKATGMGNVTVTMTFDAESITDVQIDVSEETPDIGGKQGDALAQMILDAQSATIDGVSGATVTSSAVQTAAAACIAQAKGETVEVATEAAAETQAVESTLGEATQTFEGDVVIAGAGAAGLQAAIVLSRAGKKVIVVEAGQDANSSNFAMCGGPAACESKLQAQENEWVSLDTLFGHMYNFSNTSVNGKLLRKVLGRSGQAMDTMMDLGIKMSLWPDVYDNGFRARHFLDVEGEERIKPMTDEIEKNGGQFIYGAKAQEPVVEDGKVVGLKAVSGSEVIEVRAKATLITTGGFLGNTEMQKKYFNTPVFPLGNTISDGSGIELVHKAGGVDDRGFAVLGNEMGGVSKATKGWPFTEEWKNKNEHYGYYLFGGLYTDTNGERFIDEEKIQKLPLAIGGEQAIRQGKWYVVMDSAYYEGVKENGIFAFLGSPEGEPALEEADWYRTTVEKADDDLKIALEEGWAFKADSIEELAEMTGMKRLPKTVEKYNTYCENGVDTEFGKSKTFLTPVSEGPFYAFEYVPSAWGTNGGIKVDASLRALDQNNDPIEGLYVAGVDTGSMYTMPYYDNPGSSVGLACASGVLAGDEIVAFLDGTDVEDVVSHAAPEAVEATTEAVTE